ncbi:MAG TPA: WYL domain-containing protein [Verrucomicrobiae bacterium]
MRDGHFPNTASIARDLEIDRRTIFRDMEYLRDSLGYDFEYVSCKRGFRLTKDSQELPALTTITQGELIALILAQKALAEFSGTPFEQPLQAALQKLADSFPEEITVERDDLATLISFHDFAHTPVSHDIFQTISTALRQSVELRLTYQKPSATEPELRHVRPYHLACIQRQWYLFAHDLHRDDLRRFHLSRIRSIEITETNFTRPKNFSIQKLLAGSFALHSATGQYVIRIRFTGLAAVLVQERTWHATQKITPLPDGKIDLTLNLTSLEEIERWILSWGAEAEVLAPVELRSSVTGKASHLAAKYQPSRSAS